MNQLQLQLQVMDLLSCQRLMPIAVHPSIKSIFQTGSGGYSADAMCHLVTYANAQQFFG